MKTLIAVASALFVASLGVAAENPAPPASPQPDSPLVRAAKRANRLGKKPGFVITNDNMHTLTSPARMTTTDHVPYVPVISAGVAVPPEVVARQQADAARAQVDAAAATMHAREEKHHQNQARVMDQNEGPEALYVEDPAQSEHEMQQAAQPASASSPQPSQNVTKKP
ncbi:MAG TPA: hypothetical protein VN605_03665 [Thermoanaerobaculia bacterium]|nr:hypothetical protein [Thermoanaerobaculia bacterium]